MFDFSGLRILVLGDVMLDRFLYGAVERISRVVAVGPRRPGGRRTIGHPRRGNGAQGGREGLSVGRIADVDDAYAYRQDSAKRFGDLRQWW